MSIEKFKECRRLYEEGLGLQKELESLNKAIMENMNKNKFRLSIKTEKAPDKQDILDYDGSIKIPITNPYFLCGGYSSEKPNETNTDIITQDINQAEFLEVMSTIIKRKRQRLKEIADHLMKYELDLNK